MNIPRATISLDTVPLRGRRIALIGGAGFIGHHLALALAQQGADVHVVDSLAVNNLLSILPGDSETAHGELYVRMILERLEQLRAAQIPLVIQDARDGQGLTCALRRIEPQTIVHLAAIAHANRANKDPHGTFDHSLATLANALDFARSHRVEHFVFLSSSMVYGNFITEEADEDHPVNPIGIYGALKLAAEKMVIAHQQVFDLPCTIVRPSALYGPRCVSRRVGQVFIENALNGVPLRVDGDGSEKIDFTCVDDLVEGIGLVIRRRASRNRTFNLTYGQARSIRDLVAIVRESFPGVTVQFTERDKLTPLRGTLSIKRAQNVLGYAPEIPIEAGFAQYIRWYRDLIRAFRLEHSAKTPIPSLRGASGESPRAILDRLVSDRRLISA